MAKQFLFRCYHSPIEQTDVRYRPFQSIVGQREISYSDYLCSLPETISDLSDVASRQAYGDAIMLINAQIVAVVVWEVDENVPIDEQAPVSVLHPFRSNYAQQFTMTYVPGTAQNYDLVQGSGSFLNYFLRKYTYRRRSAEWFRSFDLTWQPPPTGVTFRLSENHSAAVIARQCDIGRCKLQFMKRTVAVEDSYWSRKDTIVLNPYGTLAQLRYPMWESVITNQRFLHSGYSLLPDGSIERGRTALSNRVLMGVSEMRQQQRMYIRRKKGVNVTIDAWYLAIRKLMWFLWDNENDPTITDVKVATNVERTNFISLRQVETAEISTVLTDVCDWINLVGVAQGQTSLLIFRRGSTGAQRSAKFYELVARLRDYNGKISRWVVKGETKQLQIFRNIVDLTASVMNAVYDHDDAVAKYRADHALVGNVPSIAWAVEYRRIQEEFADRWAEITTDVLSVLNLIFSWHFTWDLYEPTRATSAATALRGRPRSKITPLQKGMYPERLPQPQRMPDLTTRFAREKPLMAPFRVVAVEQPQSGQKQAEEEEEKRRREEDAKRFYKELQDKEAADKDERYRKRAEQIEELRKEWTKTHVPDPLQPWDYRNWTNKEWMQSQLEPGDRVQFLSNMLTLPGEVAVVRTLVGRGKKVKPADVKKGATGASRELVKSVGGVKRASIAWPIIRRFVVDYVKDTVKETAKETAKEYVQNWVLDEVTRLIDKSDADEIKYDDVTFWPLDFSSSNG